jgi:hypothetical protein
MGIGSLDCFEGTTETRTTSSEASVFKPFTNPLCIELFRQTSQLPIQLDISSFDCFERKLGAILTNSEAFRLKTFTNFL